MLIEELFSQIAAWKEWKENFLFIGLCDRKPADCGQMEEIYEDTHMR